MGIHFLINNGTITAVSFGTDKITATSTLDPSQTADPGGSVDYLLASVKNRKSKDFIGNFINL
jgi:hypothetical protein